MPRTTVHSTPGHSPDFPRAQRLPARVLVVDDELPLRVLAALVLENAGYSPTAVATVGRALERIDEEGTDLVVTDLIMPGRTGLDLLESLRRSQRDVPVIVLTGSDDEELLRRVLELGARSVVRKPYSPERLRAAVAAALAGERTVDRPQAA